jgi:hypothetical protein
MALPCFTGCASMLYVRGTAEHDHPDISNKIISTQNPYKYVTLTKNKIYDTSAACRDSRLNPNPQGDCYNVTGEGWIFEFTPLGIFAPLFGYPEIHKEYDVNLELRFPDDVKVSGYIPAIKINENGNATETITFNDGFDTALKKDGEGYQAIPSTMTINIQCTPETCNINVDPAIITDDGNVQVKTQKVEDKNRLAEIAEEKAQKEREQKRQAAINKSSKCRAVVTKELEDEFISDFLIISEKFRNGNNSICSDKNLFYTQADMTQDEDGVHISLYPKITKAWTTDDSLKSLAIALHIPKSVVLRYLKTCEQWKATFTCSCDKSFAWTCTADESPVAAAMFQYRQETKYLENN